MRILTIDEDALFTASFLALKEFPRIRSIEDYRDLDFCRKEWRKFYDRYENDFQVKLRKELGILYFKVNNSYLPDRIFRVDYHDEVISVIKAHIQPNDTKLTVYNVDQHHDQFVGHSINTDCSNWASPQIISREFPNIEEYNYVWYSTELSEDKSLVREFPPASLQLYYSRIFNFEDLFSYNIGYNQPNPWLADLVVFCKSRAYVPSNFWDVLDGLYKIAQGGQVVQGYRELK